MLSFVLASTLLLGAQFGPFGPDAPAREPQMAADGNFVYLTWGAGNSVYFSRSADRGKTFDAPVKVAETGILPLSRHRGPRIAVAGKSVIVTAVAGKTLSQGVHAHGLPSDGNLLVWRSPDNGTSWSKGTAINDVPGAPTEGLHALAADAQGHLFAVWLDKRAPKGTSLYGSRSVDKGASWSKSVQIYESPDGSICECCHPSVAMDSDGQIFVMWRNWLNGARDLYLARSSDGVSFGKPEKLGSGTWQLNACPMDGGGLAIGKHRVTTAWRRNKEIFFASPGEKEVSAGEGIDVSLSGGPAGIYAIWTTAGSVRVLTPGGGEAAAIAPQGAFPNILALPGGGALAAWETEGRIEVRGLP